MPFMKGPEPIRRTVKYLSAGKLVLKEKIKVFTVNYNTFSSHHRGARDFVFWHIPQIQYKNPDVQIATLKNLTPTPFIKCYWEDGRKILIDIDGREKDEILDHLVKVVGKSSAQLEVEEVLKHQAENPANFGIGSTKACICEIRGQIPCPGVLKFPKCMRAKYTNPPK